MLYSIVLAEWMEQKELEIRKNTRKNYFYTINNKLLPEFGDLDIKNITKKSIQNFLNLHSKKHRRETVVNITKVLKQSLDYALDCGYIRENPYRNIKIKKDKYLKEVNMFTEEEVQNILNSCQHTNIKDIIILAYRTGMRIGEILALKWEDIDFELNFLTIKRTLSGYVDGVPEINLPKTKTSRRRIDLDIVTMDMLTRKFNIRIGEFVFCKEDGSIYSRQYVAQTLKSICKIANVEFKCFQTFRHTHASILLANGVHPKIVQERLGHYNISITLDTYSHLIPSMQGAAVDVFNQIK